MKRLFILLFLFAKTALNGQTGFGTYNDRILQAFQLDVNLRVNLNNVYDYSNINGSPFLQEKFSSGNVQTSKDFFKNVNMKYNIVDDAFLFEINGKELYLEPSKYVKSVFLESYNFVVRQLPNSKKSIDFVIELDSSKISIFCKKIKLYKPAEAATAIVATPKPASFVDKPNKYYIQLGSGPLIFLEKLKDIYQLFPAEAEALKKYIKTEDLEFKKEIDLIKIVQFCGAKV